MFQIVGVAVNDKHLTRERGFFKMLLPGDFVLADRGFDITKNVTLMQASLEIPAFMKGMSHMTQLTPVDIESWLICVYILRG